jgi:putative peptide zinc metalloprotease protein
MTSVSERPQLTTDSTVAIVPLSTVAHDDEYTVGNPRQGTFVNLPGIGVSAIRLLDQGLPLSEVRRRLQKDEGEEVDVLDFARTLLDLGFVSAVDGVLLKKNAPDETSHTLDLGRARWLFGGSAWTIYGMLLVFCMVFPALTPRYRLRPKDFFFFHDPVASLAVLTCVSFVVAAGHEGFHWLGARAEGVSARFSVGRRLYFLVFETDLTQLWSVPRRRRYSPLLAGLAYDIFLLAFTLGARGILSVAGVEPQALLPRALACVGAVLCVNIAWQLAFFMRNDLYAVMITLLGCVNLWRVTQLYLKEKFWHLGDAEAEEFSAAHPRDLNVARWYCWLCLFGTLGAAWFAVEIPLPVVTSVLRWMIDQVAHRPVISFGFWEAIGLAVVALLPKSLVIIIYLREHFSKDASTNRR